MQNHWWKFTYFMTIKKLWLDKKLIISFERMLTLSIHWSISSIQQKTFQTHHKSVPVNKCLKNSTNLVGRSLVRAKTFTLAFYFRHYIQKILKSTYRQDVSINSVPLYLFIDCLRLDTRFCFSFNSRLLFRWGNKEHLLRCKCCFLLWRNWLRVRYLVPMFINCCSNVYWGIWIFIYSLNNPG